MPEARSSSLLQAGCEALAKLSAGASFEELFRALSVPLMTYCGADRCLVAVLDSEGRPWRVLGRRVEDQALRRAGDLLSHYLVQQVVRRRALIYVPDARRDRRWRSMEERRRAAPIRALLGVPVRRGDRVEAVVVLSQQTAPLHLEGQDPALCLAVQVLAPALPPSSETKSPEAMPPVPSLPAAPPLLWHGVVTRSHLLQSAVRTAQQVAPSQVPVLLLGEDGTGKEAVARAIHADSGRGGAFVIAGVRAIPPALVEAELFGSVPGAFTGAVAERRGLVEQAQGGTLFLDDLAEMSPEVQRALLRVLSEGVVRPLGSETARQVDLRLIAASSVPPEELTTQGVLREDLWYRLQGVTVKLPALRERPEDIVFLFQHFLKEQTPAAAPVLSPEAQRALVLYPWPGNVRELRNEAKRLCALGIKEILPQQLCFWKEEAQASPRRRSTVKALPTAVAEAERAQILRALTATYGNKAEAARLLGITRRTLYRRLKRYGLSTE